MNRYSPAVRVFLFLFLLIPFFAEEAFATKPKGPTPLMKMSSQKKNGKQPSPAQSEPAPPKKSSYIPSFKNKQFQIIPVPVFETRPDEGNSYGLMPVLLMSEKGENAIDAIFALIGQYNSVTKFGGAALAYFYPEPEAEITLYAELAQKYAREFSTRFYDPHIGDRFFLDSNFMYLKTPFGRFYGIGPERPESGQSNFTSSEFLGDFTFGYYLFKNFRANLGMKYHRMNLLPRAIDDIADTLTRYGALPEVNDASNLINRVSVVYDTREEYEYSRSGIKADLGYFFSSEALGSDDDFQGYNLEAIHLMPLIKKNDRWTHVFRFNYQQMFGTGVPFYELSSLGGDSELRAFTPRRFIDKGKILFQIEERIKLTDWGLFGKEFSIFTDPFFELGRVFDELSDLGFNHWQPVGGLGFRLFVPPNVVGRLDLAIGSDGFEIYTQLGYPF